ncbi:NAD(P)/FAD-dependent oxidoreductase [Nocardia sp. XZ_19_385]|uniref:flavin-containing monooxygenase n=1 Tax=Nocardia sp. XZ_19_385 TaxID=2769488 RepID=UPI0028160BBE|nr:NAD(P)/FAD-dependent oxidoreductase [Nocardia sp. XZ_19_385]
MSDPVLIIGAGPGGLAAGACVQSAGREVVIVDKADTLGSAWRGHYERLHLHTIRHHSHLPGFKFARSYGDWVARENVVRYLEDYAAHHGLSVRTGVAVDKLERAGDRWIARSPQGDITAREVVVATGYNHTPLIPEWPGRNEFRGELVHSAQYRNPRPYAGRSVLVVGTGNTGAEIAVDLVEGGAARVWLAVRTVPTFVRREVAPGIGQSSVGILLRRLPVPFVDRFISIASRLTTPNLSSFGLPRPAADVYTRLLADGAIPIIDVGLIDLIKAGKIEIVGAVQGFEADKVLLANSAAIAPDAVIAATGFQHGLENLVGHLDLLDAQGRPTVHGGQTHPDAPGLYFTGFTNPISGMFRELAIDAKKIAAAIG